MKELMMYVEEIVRPVGATQRRKLRMRTELLSHLQAAWQEERLSTSGDEAAALGRAKLRLGEPIELTRQLQQSVPAIERWLLARLPLSRRFDALEQRMARVPGQRGPMTLGHKTILSAMATLAYAPFLLSLYSATTLDTPAIHLMLSMVGAVLGSLWLLLVSYRFVFETASPEEGWGWPATLKRGAQVFALQFGLMFFIAFAVGNRVATLGEVVVCAACTVATLSVATLIARSIGVRRRPYDEWLTLPTVG